MGGGGGALRVGSKLRAPEPGLMHSGLGKEFLLHRNSHLHLMELYMSSS